MSEIQHGMRCPVPGGVGSCDCLGVELAAATARAEAAERKSLSLRARIEAMEKEQGYRVAMSDAAAPPPAVAPGVERFPRIYKGPPKTREELREAARRISRPPALEDIDAQKSGAREGEGAHDRD